jgi:hypothetical protein
MGYVFERDEKEDHAGEGSDITPHITRNRRLFRRMF